MEPLLLYSLEVTIWLQENYPQLEPFFSFFTFLGNELFYLTFLPLLYWSISKQLGRIVGFLLFVSVSINTIFKNSFRSPRPFWIDPAVGLDATNGYGIPSGHAQNSILLYIIIAAWIKRSWVWIITIVTIILIGVSRIYLGAHFIYDVIAGYLIGIALLLGFVIWNQSFAARFKKRILGQKLLIALLVPGLLAGIYIGVRIIIGAPDLSVPWAAYIPEAELSSIQEMGTAIGAMIGVGIGYVLEPSRVRFRSDGPLSKRIGRYLLGMAVTILIWYGLGEIFPREPLWLAIPLRLIRYGLVGIWISYYAPMIFVRLNLADADPKPGINLKIS